MTPPQRLSQALVKLRALGFPFNRAWPIAMTYAVQGEHDDTALFWATTWIEEQRSAWESAYRRAPGPRRLLTTFDYDRSAPARSTGRTPVAA